MTLIFVTADYRILVDHTNTPVWLPLDAVPMERLADKLVYVPLRDAPADYDPKHPTPPEAPFLALRASDNDIAYWETQPGLRWDTLRSHLGQPHIAKVIARLRFEERYRFHPETGEPLQHPGAMASGSGKMVFPRIDPAVIGLVELEGQDKILLGRNARRPNYFSLIAGYVDLGETLEHAFEREVREETGRRVQSITYWKSQPWPMSGSLMVAFRASTKDEYPIGDTDGELSDIIWATRADLKKVPLPASGSIARQLIDHWEKEQQ